MRIAVIGESGVGKSTFAYSFSRFIVKQGLSCTLANFDACCRHLLYKADFDCRDVVKGKPHRAADIDAFLQNAYSSFCGEEKIAQMLSSRSAIVMDCRGGASFFLFSSAGDFLRKKSDCVALLFDAVAMTEPEDYEVAGGLALLMQRKLSVPVIPLLNKCDFSKQSSQLMLFSPPLQARTDGLLQVSGKEGVGFKELFFAAGNAKKPIYARS